MDHWDHRQSVDFIWDGYNLRNQTEKVTGGTEYSSYLYGNISRDLIIDRYGLGNTNPNETNPFFMYIGMLRAHQIELTVANTKQLLTRYENSGLSENDRVLHNAMMTCVDDVIGQLVDTLMDEGIWDDTLLFFARYIICPSNVVQG